MLYFCMEILSLLVIFYVYISIVKCFNLWKIRRLKRYIEKMMEPEYNNPKQYIKDVINKGIRRERNLFMVKRRVEEKFHRPLGSIDNAYVERKYVERCLELCLIEITDRLKQVDDSKEGDVILEIFNRLGKIRSLQEVPDIFRRLKYYKLLMEHYRLVGRENEKSFIDRFSDECLERLVKHIGRVELEFLGVVIEFLNRVRDIRSVVDELGLKEFSDGRMSFRGFLGRIIHVGKHEEVETVREMAKRLEVQENFFLTDRFREVISGYVKPIEMQERTIDDRLVLEVIGTNIAVSQILCRLEDRLSGNPEIEEVRFVGCDAMHVDGGLTDPVWNGKNLVVLSKTITVHDEFVWDVSGVDNPHVYDEDAGVGQQGKDGYSGGSGGNVLILAKKMENPENLAVVSNGGNGSGGQNGGNGRDGVDGKGIGKSEFDSKFPPVATLKPDGRKTNVRKNLLSIKEDLPEIKTAWYNPVGYGLDEIASLFKNNPTYREIFEKIIDNYDRTFFYREYRFFIEVTTRQGNDIIFSFQDGDELSNCQGLLLYKGSPGHPGGPGGEYGLGGEGGYPGEIIVRNLVNNQGFNVIRSGNRGNDGNNGKGGLYGNHGKNGWDMGYMDYSVSNFFTSRWPKFLGTDQNKKLTLTYYDADNNPSDRVWCPHVKKYASITQARNEHDKGKKYEQRNNTRKNLERQRHARAARKKNISQANILNTYSNHFNCTVDTNILDDLQLNLENNRISEIIQNQQEKNRSIQLQIERHVNYARPAKIKRSNHKSSSLTHNQTTNIQHLIGNLKKTGSDGWLRLKHIELNLTELNQLISNIPSRFTESNSVLNKLLIEKYRIGTLQEMAKKLENYPVKNPGITRGSVGRYLIETDTNDTITHPILGTLNQYLFDNRKEQRQNLSRYCKDHVQVLKSSIIEFILDVGNLEESSEGIKRYFREYTEFIENQENGFKILVDGFNELDSWIETIEDESTRNELHENIQESSSLREVFSRFNNELVKEYHWDQCCVDRDIREAYYGYIQESSTITKAHRELLSYAFDTNIRVYIANEDGKLFLRDNHNPVSKRIIHVLHKDESFKQLSINEEHLRLESNRREYDQIHTRILIEIDSFQQKRQLDDYLETFDKNHQEFDRSDFNKHEGTEEEDLMKILEYFPEGERPGLRPCLEKITSRYITQHRILYEISRRFCNEGRHVTSQEMHFLINSILSSNIEDRNEQNIFCWIIAAYAQRNWTNELILIHLENYFKKTLQQKPVWREYLSKIRDKSILVLFHAKLEGSNGSVSAECIQDILRLLYVTDVQLDGLGLHEWPYALNEIYWSNKLSELINWRDDEELLTACYYLLSIENVFGTDVLSRLVKILEKNKPGFSSGTLVRVLTYFHNEEWELTETELADLEDWNINEWEQKMQIGGKKQRDLTQLIKLIESNGNTSKRISGFLPRIGESIRRTRTCGFDEDDIKAWVKTADPQDHDEMLRVIDRAIELKRGFRLRDTQKLTVLALLMNDRSTLAQVCTGEGKSLIVVALSIMKVLGGKRVDVITSSSVLAKRDAQINRDIYSLFGINVSDNCNEDIEKRKEAYSNNRVVYGELSNFQRDYLLDKFYGEKILTNYCFENVIVDEVDSMLLDRGNNMLYLTHYLPDLDKLESVYIYIWQWINRPAGDFQEYSMIFNGSAIKEAVLYDLYGLIKKEDIQKLDSDLSDRDINVIWERLVEQQIIDGQGRLLKDDINDEEIKTILTNRFGGYQDRLRYLLDECIDRERRIRVPNHLRDFVERRLESWIESAKIAFFMKIGQDYVVDVDRSGTSPDRNPNITIIDRDTGTDQVNSQWDRALHQFLQLKHGCRISMQSLKAVFISNVSFFKLYEKIYGLTGTLGSHRERDLLQEIHQVDFVTIPTAINKEFHEYKPIICGTKQEWIRQIRDEVRKQLKRKRSVLIICETVDDVDTVRRGFQASDDVYTYRRDYEEFDVVQGVEQLGSGKVIIATNLAGRGTDIKITEQLRQAGGLHVCLSYLPNNIRIEQQAFGRAARAGDEGSGQLIVVDTERKGSSMISLKKDRDSDELHRISHIKTYYETRITLEEEAFEAFKQQYEQLKKLLGEKKVRDHIKEIILSSCLAKWAFWLDKNDEHITDSMEKPSSNRFKQLLDEFIGEFRRFYSDIRSELNQIDGKLIRLKQVLGWCDGKLIRLKQFLGWFEGNPIEMIKLGKYYSQNRMVEDAIELFDKVIKQEPHFSEAAHYYKAFALGKLIDENNPGLKKIKEELRETVRLLSERIRFCVNAAGVISNVKEHNKESIIQIDAYEQYQRTLAGLYNMFSQSIDDILGNSVTSDDFTNDEIDDDLAEAVYDDLIRGGVLKKPRIKKNIPEEDLKTICFTYGTPVEVVRKFFSEHNGKEIDERKFQKTLKQNIQLSSREDFWKSLIEQQFLTDQVKYVMVDDERLKTTKKSLPDLNIEKKENIRDDNERIFLYPELLDQQTGRSVYEKKDFINAVGIDDYQMLKKKGILSFNSTAKINKGQSESVRFTHYDSVTPQDFSNINIPSTEAEMILKQLVEQKVLGRSPEGYRLKIEFDEIEWIEQSFCSVYEDAVKGLLSACFSYRIAFQRLLTELEEKNFPPRLRLTIKPHRSLISMLLDQRIIKLATVTTTNEDKLKKILKKRLPNEDMIKSVIRVVERSGGVLKALKVPDTQLNPLDDLSDRPEMYILCLNGLDGLLQLGEKKWTRRMLRDCLVVTLLGIGQIAIGVVMEIYSVGLMTHVAGGFMSEGVNDIFYAVGSLRSGYFSWKDYRRDKLISVAFTALTCCIGGYLSRGSKVSRYGSRLAEPNLQIAGQKVSEMSGKQLIDITGKKVIMREATKRFALKTVEGIAYGVVNVGVDMMVEKYLSGLCEDVASKILSNIEQSVEQHDINKSLEKAYWTLGEEKARKIVDDATSNVFTKQNGVERLVPTVRRIAGCVIRGIAEASSKAGGTSEGVNSALTIVCKITSASNYLSGLHRVSQATNSFLDDLDREIKNRLPSETDVGPKPNEAYDRFRTEMIDRWKSSLRKKVGRIIQQCIVVPILTEGANHLLRYAGNKIKETYETYKNHKLHQHFKDLKEQFEKESKDVKHDGDTSQPNEHDQKYQDNLMKLMKKTRNPELFKDMIKEDVPMDLVCAKATTVLVHKILEKEGVQKLTVIVQTDKGVLQEFSHGTGEVGVVIRLDLQDNHYQLCGTSKTNNDTKNNCLYTALVEAVPELKDRYDPDQFRSEVSDCIHNNLEIRNYIQRGWHELDINLGAFGGYRDDSNRLNDEDSSEIGDQDLNKYIYREHSFVSHLVSRFTRYVRFGGQIQRISEETGIPRENVVRGGPSRFQDKSSKRGRDIHAAHVIQVEKIDPKIGNDQEYKQGLSSVYYNELRNTLGHTQNVDKCINHGVGRKIDKFQSENLNKLSQIDFQGPPAEAITIIEHLKDSFKKIIDDKINDVPRNQRSELIKVQTALNDIKTKDIYEMAKKGYTGEGMERYQEPYNKKNYKYYD